ncbi:MAG: HlyD family efflux transporter periplasmic adaptor subunit [Phycisphaerales bacterium]|nr:HlyD family efflux transporter periplasmic adaptor subunit [Phycisphaerales bacterium]
MSACSKTCSLGIIAAVLLILSGGCDRTPPNLVQGYVEGEFVYIASPLAGQLEKLNVQRGDQVKQEMPLFELESEAQRAALHEAQQQVDQSQATLADLKKGSRPTEMVSIQARLETAKAALEFSQSEYARLLNLSYSQAASKQDLDRSKSMFEQDRQRVAQLQADVATAQLGARPDQIAAAEAALQARRAALEKARWDLSQKSQAAPQQGVVFDTLYRQGEWVAAGRPVVVLLPPQNIKVRAFVPEQRVGNVHLGDAVRVKVDGRQAAVAGKIRFISPRAEYTPPVIYSTESRSKLVFMVEVALNSEDASKLHPGLPVDVELGK